MKRAFLALIAVLVASPVFAQVQPNGFPSQITPPIFGNPSAVNGGGGFSGQLAGPVTCAAPAYSFTGDLNTGYGASAADTGCLVAGGSTIASFASTGLNVSTGALGVGVTPSGSGNLDMSGGLSINTSNPGAGSLNAAGSITAAAAVNIGTLLTSASSATATTGAVGSYMMKTKSVSAIANAVATDIFTVTIPNAQNMAGIEATLNCSLGAGGAVGAGEGSASIKYNFAVTRTAGLATVVGASAAYGSSTAIVAGAATITLTAAATAMTGANNATQTFTIQATVSRGSGSSTNHTCRATAEILNAQASGITIQ